MKPINLTESNFDHTVALAQQPVIVDFWAEWSGPCKLLTPVLHELATEHADRTIVAQVDVDANPNLARRFKVTALPTLIVFRNGTPVNTIRGVCSKGYLEAVLNN
ncbi:MAG TPA: thioredoxin [Verrucomicrobiae bacterium]